MTVETLSSLTITNLEATPRIFSTAGEGAFGSKIDVQDYVAHTVAFGSAAKNTSRQARIPVDAKVKHVWTYTKGLDSNAAATLTLDINLAFSDSTIDGTPVSIQAAIPTSALDGTITTLTAYASANKMFGAAYAVANSGAVKFTDVTYNNTYTPALAVQPLWAALGGSGTATANPLASGGGFAQNASASQITSPGGYVDVLYVVAGTAATAATGTIGTEVDYVL